VDNHILRLRQKLEIDPSDPLHFLTVHRVGYKFVPYPRHDFTAKKGKLPLKLSGLAIES
jgi:DNA-binding winged helix-turn-helix (wHTH) protein